MRTPWCAFVGDLCFHEEQGTAVELGWSLLVTASYCASFSVSLMHKVPFKIVILILTIIILIKTSSIIS